MNRIRGALASFIALASALVAFGVQAAPEKIFSVSLSTGVIAPATPTAIDVTIRNETPNGNSSINSLTVSLPAGYAVANTPADPPTANWPGQVTWTATAVSLSNMSPLKPRQSFVLKVKATAGGTAATCSAATWNAQAWTGSSFSGDTFRQLFPPEANVTSTTTIATGLALQIQPLAGAVVKNVAFGVTVTTTSSCPVGTTLPEAAVTLGGTPAFTGGGQKTTNGGTATWPSTPPSGTGPTFGSVGPATLTASAPGFGGTSLQLLVYDGTLQCEPNEPFEFSAAPISPVGSPLVNDITQTGYAKGRRGEFNKDGVGCVAVAYTFTNDILANNQVSLVWDTTSQPGAAFEYTATWKDEYVDATTGLPTLKTRVQWAGLAAPVVGKACLAPDLPEPYGTLAGGIGAGATSITVTPSAGAPAVPPAPFPIIVGGERMQVTLVSGTTWTVARGQGGTAAAAQAVGKSVMSTPLPLDASGNEMRMCIVSETWTTVLPGAGDCTAPDAGAGSFGPRACVRVRTTVFDVGDGVMIRGGG